MMPSTTVPTYGTDLLDRHDQEDCVIGEEGLPNLSNAVLEELGVRPYALGSFGRLTSNG